MDLAPTLPLGVVMDLPATPLLLAQLPPADDVVLVCQDRCHSSVPHATHRCGQLHVRPPRRAARLRRACLTRFLSQTGAKLPSGSSGPWTRWGSPASLCT